MMRQAKVVLAAALAAGVMATPLCGQSGVAAAPHAAGTVKATSDTGLTLTTSTGDVYTVTVPSTAKVLVVAPGSKDLKAATAGSLSDVAPADKAIVTGTAGDTGLSLTAVRVILMKSQAIADSHAAEDAAWAQGGGGIVRSVDAAAGTITVGRGTKTLNVTVGPATIIRRYAGDSVRFADAQASTLAAIQPGDQLRVRGTKSADGSTIAADELVTGSFRNYSGLIASITPGESAGTGTVTLKDLTTKKTVVVAVTANSDVRRIPAAAAQRFAAQIKGGAGAGAAGTGSAGTSAMQGAGGSPAGARPADAGAAGAGQRGPGSPGSGAAATEATGETRRAGMDLSQMLPRLPTETLGGLKVGDAVMMVATGGAGDSAKSTAVTLLVGVEAILSASPSGQGMTLSPWSLGGEGGEGGMQGGSAQRVAPTQ